MPLTGPNPYSFRKTSSNKKSFVYRSLRMDPDMFAEIEAMAAKEHISVNSLCNAICAMAVELDGTEEGHATIHQFCTTWRSRYEHTETAKRQARLEGE